MDELEYLLRQIVRNQPSLSQVVISSEQFTGLTEMVSSVCELARNKSETCISLAKQVKQKTLENEGLQKDGQKLAQSMDLLKADLSESISVLRKEVRSESSISERWLKEVRRERDKNEFLETTLRDYSSKVAVLRADANLLRRQTEAARRDKDFHEENFKRADKALQDSLGKVQDLRDHNRALMAELEQIKVAHEMEIKAEKLNHNKASKTLLEETRDLVEQLKEKQDLAAKFETQTKMLRDELSELKKGSEKLAKEKTKLSDELQKAKDQSKKLQEENQKLKKDNKSKDKTDKGFNSRVAELEKLNSELEDEVKKYEIELNDLQYKLENEFAKTKHSEKSYSRDKMTTAKGMKDLEQNYDLLVELLKKGLTAKYKKKCELLGAIFEISDLELPKVKKSYLDLVKDGDTNPKGKSTKQEPEKSLEPPRRGMDIELQPGSRPEIRRNSLSPEKMQEMREQVIPEDTAYKAYGCSHTEYVAGCTFCQVLNKDFNQLKNPLIKPKLKKGG